MFKNNKAIPTIFVSYSRSDAAFARGLHEKLNATGSFNMWRDRSDMEGGKDWWKQIQRAIEDSDTMVLAMSPAAIASTTVTKEWQYARQVGTRVIPVIADDVDFQEVTPWMRKLDWPDIRDMHSDHDTVWENFLRTLQTPYEPIRVPFMAPDVAERMVQRHAEMDKVLSHLLDESGLNPTPTVIALVGMGGIGKTALAASICHKGTIIDAYSDGILWVTLGENPSLLGALGKLYSALSGDYGQVFVDEEEARNAVANILTDKQCLIVVDDVWNQDGIGWLPHEHTNCAYLLTTRNPRVAIDAVIVTVDEMTDEESVELLGSRLQATPKDFAPLREASNRLGNYPLLLELCSAVLQLRRSRGDSIERSLEYINQSLDEVGVTAFDREDVSERNQAIAKTIEASLGLLSIQNRENYLKLGIFPEDVEVPLDTLAYLWGLTPLQSERTCDQLANLSLIKLDLRSQSVSLHDILRTFLNERLTNPAEAHASLIARWGNINNLPSSYAWRWIGYHLIGAQQLNELVDCLTDVGWLAKKLQATDIDALIMDYDLALLSLVPGSKTITIKNGQATAFISGAMDQAIEEQKDLAKTERRLYLLQGALRLGSHVLRRDKTQLRNQLFGRLGDSQVEIDIQHTGLVARSSGLDLKSHSLARPGGRLLRTIPTNGYPVFSLNITADNKWIIGTDRAEITVWDLYSGAVRQQLNIHPNPINVIKLAPGGKNAISAATDLKLWRIEDGVVLQEYAGHSEPITTVIISSHDGSAISGSYDSTIKIWDLESGSENCSLNGHQGAITDLVLTPDESILISSSADTTVKIWDLGTSKELITIDVHQAPVTSVSVSPDGQFLVSVDLDGIAVLWNLKKGELETRIGLDESTHTNRVNSIDITPDGRYLVLGSGFTEPDGSESGSLAVLNLMTKQLVSPIQQLRRPIDGVAALSDSKHVVCVCKGGPTTVWNILDPSIDYSLENFMFIWPTFAISHDERYMVTGEYDCIKLWDLLPRQSGVDMTDTFIHDRQRVTCIALINKSQRVATGSDDTIGKIWDLESAQQTSTLVGHDSGITTINVTLEGDRIVSGDENGTIIVWNAKDGTLLHRLLGHKKSICEIKQIAGTNYYASIAHFGRYVRVWDIQLGKMIAKLPISTSELPALASITNAEGNYVLASSGSGTIIIWEIPSGRLVRKISGKYKDGDDIFEIRATPDGAQMLIVGGHEITVCKFPGGRERFVLEGGTPCLITQDSKLLGATTSDGTIVFSSLETGNEKFSLQGDAQAINSLSISEDDEILAAAFQENLVQVWRLSDLKLIGQFYSDDPIHHCQISSDGKNIIACEFSGRVHILEVTSA